MEIHHIGYLVRNLEESARQFEILGWRQASERVHDERRRVQICFLKNNDTLIELVQPDKDCEIIGTALKRLRNTPYHICYECRDLDDSAARLGEQGYHVIDTPSPAPAIEGKRVVFLYGSDVGLIELVEEKG